MSGRPNHSHAKERAPVSFPGQVPGTVAHGRLVAIGGRKRADDVCRIQLPSGKFVTRRLDQITLLSEAPTAPRVLP